MAWVITAVALVIAAPMGIWLGGAPPGVASLANFAAVIAAIRLYALAANLSTGRSGILYCGLFSGLIGSLAAQIVLHAGGAQNLAGAFSAYGAAGPMLFRLDMLTWWWPFLFVLLSGIFYTGLALAVNAAIQFRRVLLDL